MAIFSFKVRHEHVRKFINFCFQRFRQKEIQKKKTDGSVTNIWAIH
jgi:hypothetical protein